MKKVVFLIAAATLFVGCKSKQAITPVASEVEVNVPCSEYKTDKDNLRAVGSAISPNMQNAKDKALAAARRELATSMAASVQRVLEVFASSYDTESAASFNGRTKDLSRQVTNQMVVGNYVVCDKITKTTNPANGSVMYNAYVALEVGNDDLFKSLEKQVKTVVSDDSKLRTDFEYEKFKETFYEEMKKAAEE